MFRADSSQEKIGQLPRLTRCRYTDIQELRKTLVITTAPSWAVVPEIALNTQTLLHVTGNTEAAMASVATAASDAEVIYGIGGGLAVDTAKYVAAANDLPLIALPTILSTDAFLTDTTGIRADGGVRYLPTKAPDTVIVDMDVLCAAPPNLRATGAADILSIGTALWDWQEAEKMGENPPEARLTPQGVNVANVLLQTLLDNAREIGRGTPNGLGLLLDLLCLEVQLCHLCGHSRLEEGSEHYFAYALESHLVSASGTPDAETFVHGELVGLSILLMAVLQSQSWQKYRHALECLQIDYSVSAVSREAIADTLIHLSEYVAYHNLPYTVATTLRITPDIAERTIKRVLD